MVRKYCISQFGLFKITNAAITPGTHPASVKIKVMSTDPQPLSMTERGGKRIARRTRKKLMGCVFR